MDRQTDGRTAMTRIAAYYDGRTIRMKAIGTGKVLILRMTDVKRCFARIAIVLATLFDIKLLFF